MVLTGVCIPLVHLHVTSALRRLDPALEDVAMSLGWPPAKVALRLVMPQVKRAVASGALLAFLYTLADFGVVATMRNFRCLRDARTGCSRRRIVKPSGRWCGP